MTSRRTRCSADACGFSSRRRVTGPGRTRCCSRPLPPSRPGTSSVDVGAGTGAVGLMAAARVRVRVVLVERDPALAELCRKNLALNGLDGEVAVADILDQASRRSAGLRELGARIASSRTRPSWRRAGPGSRPTPAGQPPMCCRRMVSMPGSTLARDCSSTTAGSSSCTGRTASAIVWPRWARGSARSVCASCIRGRTSRRRACS